MHSVRNPLKPSPNLRVDSLNKILRYHSLSNRKTSKSNNIKSIDQVILTCLYFLLLLFSALEEAEWSSFSAFKSDVEHCVDSSVWNIDALINRILMEQLS